MFQCLVIVQVGAHQALPQFSVLFPSKVGPATQYVVAIEIFQCQGVTTGAVCQLQPLNDDVIPQVNFQIQQVAVEILQVPIGVNTKPTCFALDRTPSHTTSTSSSAAHS